MEKSKKTVVTVKDVKSLIPQFSYPKEKWMKWKVKPCDAGFEPGDEMVFENGVKLVKGQIKCFSGIQNIASWIWGMTYDAKFPWIEEVKGIGTISEKTMMGVCPDTALTVVFEIKKKR